MDDAMKPPLRIEPDPATLARAAADRVVDTLRAAIDVRGRAWIALAGGSTPRATYEELAGRRDALDWSVVEFFWSDERVVPPDHPDSNVRMAREALLDPLGIDAARIHPPRTELGADDAATAYEIELRTRAPDDGTPHFDLILLGMGDDGHTASLFPGGAELDVEENSLVVSSTAPFDPPERVTFTLPLIDAARSVLFVVSGAAKAPALRRIFDGDRDLPAARVAPRDGELLWMVDADAADVSRRG